MTEYQKESACGCAGVFSAHAAIELYAEVFDRGQIKSICLRALLHTMAQTFMALKENTSNTITLEKKSLG